LPGGPKFGDQIVGSESNAVAYYNSVVGARTNKYGDFLDVAAAVTGRVPYCGLHTDEGRRGQVLITLEEVPEALRRADIFYHLLGHLVGRAAGSAVPVIDGLPATTSKDQLKAVSAAVAASGGVGLFHAVGVTPEAPSQEAAFQGREPERRLALAPADLEAARAELSPARDGPLDLVALGTPHFSFTEFAALVALLDGRRVDGGTLVYVSTSRHVRDLVAAKGWLAGLTDAGVRVIVDTCTYLSPAMRECRGRVMTNSAKWAYYAPGLLPVEVAFGSLEECVESAVRGEVWRDDKWTRSA
jgi:predicted aconitase